MTDAGHRPLTGGSRAVRGDVQSAYEVVSLVFFVVSLLASLSAVPNSSAPAASAFTGSMDGCNPFAKPGYLEHDPYPVWRPFDETCEPPRLFAHLLSSLPTASAGPVANFRSAGLTTQARQGLERVIQNRTVLLVGDTVDRSMVQNLCTMLGLSSVSVTADHAFGDALKNVESTGAPGDTLLADYCYVEQYDTFFTSFYHYGIETSDVWNKQPTYYPPQRFETRVEELLGPYLQALSGPRNGASLPPRRKGIDLAVFSSGLWDLATWAMEDVQMGVASSQDLTSQRIKNWRSRTVDMLSSLRSKVGKARISWRSIPYPDAAAHGSVRSLLSSTRAPFKPTDESNERPFVYANRIAQLNNARTASLSLRGADSIRGTLGQVWTPTSHPTIGDIPLAEMTLGQESSGLHTVFSTTLNPDAMLFWDAVLSELQTAVA